MTSIELLNTRATNDPEIVLTLQEWRDLWDEIWPLLPEEQLQYDELQFNRMFAGKQVQVLEAPPGV